MKNLNIAVIGGTGKSGKFVVQQLLQQQFNLKLLLRDPQSFNIQDNNIEIQKGDARDFNSVNALIKDCQLVISTLGQPKGEKSIFSDATRNIIKAMKENGIKRYLVTTGLSVNTPYDAKNEKVQLATNWMYNNYPETTGDKQREYEILSQSDLDWTMIRLPLIKETNETFGYKVSLNDCLGDSISASDLGKFIVNEIAHKDYLRMCLFLYNE